ncbi:MAG: undecaprenyl-diphosphate phosphatase [Candidatus Omnitrophota bacterium]|jgi:undecaprenyl-diphosphatase
MIKYVILGAVQGVTEFFPVSSSAHLVIFQKILGIGNGGLVFPVVLHLGTLLATILYFRRDILRMAFNKKQLLLTAIVTIITGLIAFPAKGLVEKMFVSPRLASLALLVTGAALILTGRLRGAVKKDVSLPDAAVMGAAQGVAVLPGISRSGVTISALLLRGIDRETCFKFSFIAGIPAVAGAALLDAGDITAACDGSGAFLLAGFIASFTCGLLTLVLLKRVIIKSGLPYFGYYCLLAAAATFIFIK